MKVVHIKSYPSDSGVRAKGISEGLNSDGKQQGTQRVTLSGGSLESGNSMTEYCLF